jgi:outer membrane protein OmpA-like peptidoglycan-associated protein
MNPAPPATFATANTLTVECGQAKPSPLTYSNGLVGDCAISGTVISRLSVANVATACGQDITETWDTTDACGNKIHAERIIHVNAAPPPPPPPPAELEKIQMSSQFILFKTGSAIIEPRLYQTLDVLVEIMKGHPDQKWIVEGHADNTGSDKINDPLSQRRADAVKEYLVKKGVKADNITSIGYGSKKPIASNATAAGRAKNRRAEVKPAQ